MKLHHVRVQISHHLYHERGGLVIHKAQIEVQTDRDQYSLVELVPEDDFTRRFDWFVDRAKHEISTLLRKSG